MKKATWKKTSFAEKIVEIIRTSPSINEMREQLQDYHDNDIAQSLQFLNRAERNLLYSALEAEWLAEIISYLDDPAEYIDEIGIVYVNGNKIEENYAKNFQRGDSDIKYPLQVSDNSYFVLSDERDNMTDSRNEDIGLIKKENIIGKIIFRIWPFKKIGTI